MPTTVSDDRCRTAPRAARILRCYRQATAPTVDAGLNWYRDAHATARSLDPGDPRRAAGVIAALSPRLQWARNLELAARAYADGHATGTLGASCRAANTILGGAEPLDVLAGPKVRAFFTLIAQPDDPRTVCVDRHAIDIAVGARMSDAERTALYPLATGGLYQAFARCYRRAATHLGVSPAQVQAVTWLHWRASLRPGSTAVTTTV